MFVDDIFNMELKHHLFDLKINGKIPIWDIIRFHIFYKYAWPDVNVAKQGRGKRFREIIRNLKNSLSSLPSFLFKKTDNIIFSTSRYFNDKGHLFDKASYEVIKYFGKNALIIESKTESYHYCFSSEYNYISYYLRIKRDKERLPFVVYQHIEQALTLALGEARVTYDELNILYKSFLKEYQYYHFLFKFKKAKRLFFVQNGIQKGMIAAALDLNMQVVELQHGSFNREHLAYSYPSCVHRSVHVIFPQFVLTLGQFWGTGMNIPALKVVPIGNNYFVPDHSPVENDGSILFISSMIHGNDLAEVAMKFSKKHPHKSIYFKLHTNEYQNEYVYLELFKDYSDIKIVKNEIDLNTLIKRSSLVILIASTVLYEALSLGHKVAIYKRVNYHTQQDCFGLPNVFLFDSLEELEMALQAPEREQNFQFFESFHEKLFTDLITNQFYE